MMTRVRAFGAAAAVFVGAACSSGGSTTNGFGTGNGAGSGGTNGGGNGGMGAGGGDGGSASSDAASPGTFGDASSGGGRGGQCAVTNPNGDMDKDGWSPNQGDCNDCDPNVNPGAIDVLHSNDGGAPSWGDEDCDGKPGDSAGPCDMGLALDDVNAGDAAKAIELCQTATMSDRRYGVISATYMRADGTALPSPGLQVGIESAFGSNVHVQGGQNMLALSSGHARTIGQTGACNGISCQTNASGTPPTGFPQDDPACPPTKVIADDVALELQIRVPTNAKSYSFNFKFYSFEYPDWVCDSHGYNDQFVVLVTPPPPGAYVPAGSQAGNISFDSNNHPVSVNLGFFDVCDPSTPTRFASHCTAGGGTCPTLPSPYCPLGVGELAGTGFDTWHTGVGPAGGTRWLQTQAPAQPGTIITVRFAMWDAGNSQYDSSVLVDNFRWSATPGSTVGTMPEPMPQ